MNKWWSVSWSNDHQQSKQNICSQHWSCRFSHQMVAGHQQCCWPATIWCYNIIRALMVRSRFRTIDGTTGLSQYQDSAPYSHSHYNGKAVSPPPYLNDLNPHNREDQRFKIIHSLMGSWDQRAMINMGPWALGMGPIIDVFIHGKFKDTSPGRR